MNRSYFRLYKFLVLSTVFLVSSGCLSAFKNETDQEPVQIRKHIQDVDYRVSSEKNILKKKVLVLPFLDKDAAARPESIREQSREAFTFDLVSKSSVLPADLSQLKLSPEKYIKNNEYDLKRLSQDVQKQGISSIVEGQIVDVRLKSSAEKIGLVRSMVSSYEVVVKMRIYNVRTENEVFNTVKTVTLDEKTQRIVERVSSDQFFANNPDLLKVLIKDAFLDFVPQIQEALVDISWEGRIAAIRGDKIYLNVGRISGVQIGDILKVVEDGSEIYDSEIGYHIGRVRGRTKGTLEVVSYFGQDGAVAVLHSGANFKESDRIEAYSN